MASMRTRIRRAKNWEREVARMFRDIGHMAKRNLTETREGTSGDVLVWDKTQRHVILTIECKCTRYPERMESKAMMQAMTAAELYDLAQPVVFMKFFPRKGMRIYVRGCRNKDHFKNVLTPNGRGEIITKYRLRLGDMSVFYYMDDFLEMYGDYLY